MKLWLALSLALYACAPTDTGNPPLQWDPTKLSGNVITPTLELTVNVHGSVGAAVGAERVRFMTLGEPIPMTSCPVQADGSFSCDVVLGNSPKPARLWFEAGRQRSLPFDFRVDVTTVVPASSTLPSCLHVVEEQALDYGDVETHISPEIRELELTNACAQDVQWGAHVRDPDFFYYIDGATSGTIAAGTTATLRVALDASHTGEIIDALLLETTAPSAGEGAVTLFANVVP